MPQKQSDITAKICETTLRLAAKQTWEKLSLEEIARSAKIPMTRVKAVITEKNQILPILIGWIDRCAAKKIGTIDVNDAPRDRLFEVMMARFDILQAHRPGIIAMCDAAKR